MTNCNYSEHTKMQRKEIQKQIEELQAKLEELEKQEPQMTLDKSGDIDVVSYNQKYYYRMGFASTGRSWWVRNIGHTALIMVHDPETLVKLEQLYEDMILDTGGVAEEGTWNYDPDAKFRKQEQVKKLQEKDWTYKVTDEKGETNPYKQYLNNIDKEEYPYKKYTPEETEKSLKDAMKTAKAEDVFDKPKPEPEPLTLKQLLKKWEIDFAANWAIPKNRSSELYEEELERFIQMFIEWMPDAVDDVQDDWDDGYNAYHDTVMENLK